MLFFLLHATKHVLTHSIMSGSSKRKRSNRVTLNEYQAEIQNTSPPIMQEKLSRVYPITHTASYYSPLYYHDDVPASSYVPMESTTERGLLKYNVLTLQVLCKLMSNVPESSKIWSKMGDVLSRAAGLGGALMSGLKFLSTIDLDAHANGISSNLVTSALTVTAAATATTGTGLGATYWYKNRNPKRTLQQACEQGYEALCKRDGIPCAHLRQCKRSYMAYFNDRHVLLENYLRLPKKFYDLYLSYQHEFMRANEESSRELALLVSSYYHDLLQIWLKFTKDIPSLVDEVGIFFTLLFYSSYSRVWRQVLGLVVRKFLDVLLSADSQRDKPSYRGAIRSLIIGMCCNATDTSFQNLIAFILTTNRSIDTSEIADAVAESVRVELLTETERLSEE